MVNQMGDDPSLPHEPTIDALFASLRGEGEALGDGQGPCPWCEGGGCSERCPEAKNFPPAKED